LSRLETGDFRSLNADALKRIAAALNVTVDYLVGNSTEMSPADHLVADQSAMALFQNYNRLKPDEKEKMIAFSRFLQRGDAGRSRGERQTSWDTRLALEHISWEIASVERSREEGENGPVVRYDCRLRARKLNAGAYGTLKRPTTEEGSRARITNEQVLARAEATGTDARSITPCLDESEILESAMENAKALAYRKLVEAA
jgi:transcriptional regulator with XRE-family HTH domain